MVRRSVFVTLLLLAACAARPAPSSAAAGPGLSVDVSAGRHPISELIYGWNPAAYYNGTFEDERLEAELGITVERFGGNANTTFNWKNDVTNTGSDYFFENQVRPFYDSAGPGPRQSDGFVRRNLAHGEVSIVTVPLVGWTPKDSPDQPPFLCSYPTVGNPPQEAYDKYDRTCGNGVGPDGDHYDADPTRAYFKIDERWAQDYAAHNAKTFGPGRVSFYSLDNEPDLWEFTHHDVHPWHATYEEIASLGATYAAAVKAGDPKAQVLGPVVSGWCGIFFSPADGEKGPTRDFDTRRCVNGADRRAHGDLEHLRYYLREMRRRGDGRRLLDYLDVHWYAELIPAETPLDEDRHVFEEATGSAGDAETQAARLRMVRNLWDPTYVDDSWIGRDAGAPPIELIPRLKRWIAAEYPGTKLAITEYSFGGWAELNGALAQADVLGVFGREGVDLATLFATPRSEQPGAFSFRMFRSYDGRGGRFGDVAVSSTSTDQGRLAVYGAQRSTDGATTVIVINKSTEALDATLSLRGAKVKGREAQRFTYSGADLKRIVPSTVPVDRSGWTTTYPASSITLVVLR